METLDEVTFQPTDTYPVRYQAFDHPGIFWTGDIERKGGGSELAVFADMGTNPVYPHLTDGIYCAVVRYQNVGYLVEGSTTTRDSERRQFNLQQIFSTYDLAIIQALEYIRKARIFMQYRARA